MPSIFERLFKIGQSEAHDAIDKFEDPIKLSEQAIRDLESALGEALSNLAKVKSIAIRLGKDAETQSQRAAEYERKAMLLLQRMQNGDIDAAEAERLATAALEKKAEADASAQRLSTDHAAQRETAERLEAKVETLKRQIDHYKNELTTLRARARTAESMKKINQTLSGVDTSSTVALLEKMQDKVAEEESLAQAYGELGDVGGNLDKELDDALAESGSQASASLDELKKRMGITT